jgi:hypothetical protein
MRAGPSEIAGVRALSPAPAALPPPRRENRFAVSAIALTIAAAGLGGCGASIDMASGGSAARATMTVPYTNVREEVRLYPDYGPIGASILASGGAANDDKRPASPKKGQP